MKAVEQIRRRVKEELERQPGLAAAEVQVGVTDAIVTLTGRVDSFAARLAAEEAALRVGGVMAVVDELAVDLPATAVRDDVELAREALDALRRDATIPAHRLRLTVDHGRLTLEGEVDWHFQKDAAFETLKHLPGVRGVTNRVTVIPQVTAPQIRDRIEAAFRRAADLDAGRIAVELQGATVILRGTVRSWAEYQAAEWAVWSAPGVVSVENRLIVAHGPELPPLPAP